MIWSQAIYIRVAIYLTTIGQLPIGLCLSIFAVRGRYKGSDERREYVEVGDVGAQLQFFECDTTSSVVIINDEALGFIVEG